MFLLKTCHEYAARDLYKAKWIPSSRSVTEGCDGNDRQKQTSCSYKETYRRKCQVL